MFLALHNDEGFRRAYESFCSEFAKRTEFLTNYSQNPHNSLRMRDRAYRLLMELVYRRISFMLEYAKNAKALGDEL